MFLERLQNNNNVYKFKLGSFLDAQYLIADKYMDKLEIYKDMDVLDKYILHTMEEIWEVKHAEDELEFYEELSDVIMYLGSMYSILSFRNKLDVNKEEDMFLTATNVNSNFSVSDIVDEIISIRRFYPERKWHKNEKNEVDNSEVDIISMNLLKNMIRNFVNIMILNTDFDFNDYVYNKQQMLIRDYTIESKVRTLKPMTVYRHFKDKLYVVIGESLPSSELKNMKDYLKNVVFTSVYTEDVSVIIDVVEIDGKLYHSDEDYDKPLVVYKALYNDEVRSYVRDKDMFLSKVDKDKYPNAYQTYRFEVATGL